MSQKCPLCGSPGEPSFSGFACTSPDCRNFAHEALTPKPTPGPEERPAAEPFDWPDPDDWGLFVEVRALVGRAAVASLAGGMQALAAGRRPDRWFALAAALSDAARLVKR